MGRLPCQDPHNGPKKILVEKWLSNQKLLLWISFWTQKLTQIVTFWIQKLTKIISFWTKIFWIQKLTLWNSFWVQKHQFMHPETDIKHQFLVDHPETDIMDQFLDPETDTMGERTYIEGRFVSGQDRINFIPLSP